METWKGASRWSATELSLIPEAPTLLVETTGQCGEL